jgi:hypothetical protein
MERASSVNAHAEQTNEHNEKQDDVGHKGGNGSRLVTLHVV